MQTLTKEQSEIIIPDKIQDKINERWFYLYSFITPNEVKNSIERDYLKILSFIALPLWIISIVLWVIALPLFLACVWIVFAFIIIYLIILSIKRSITLTHTSNVVLTDKAISIWWKIIKNEDLDKEKWIIQKYEREFDEKIFWDSRLSEAKWWLLKQVIEKVTSIFWKIFETTKHFDNRNSAQIMLIWMLLWVVYVAIISGIYFIWIFIIWIFWLFIMTVNKAILKVTWQKVFKINNLFDEIDKSSDNLIDSKNKLSLNLNNATQSKWQDWLLNEINSWIKKVNNEADVSIKNILKLRKTLENSNYKDIFNFNIYNNWIKKQIVEPLKSILELLSKNKEIIEKTIEELEIQISETKEISYKNTLEVQKLRLEKQKEEFEKYRVLINSYIEKIS